jgi:hypothetical protein
MDKKRKQLVEYVKGAVGGIQAQARALVSADRLQIALDAIANANDKLSTQKWTGSLRHICSESQSGVKVTTQNILQTIFNITDADYKARFAPITDGTNAVLQGHIDLMVQGFLNGVIPIYSVDCNCEDIFVGDAYKTVAAEQCAKVCTTGSASGSASASASGSLPVPPVQPVKPAPLPDKIPEPIKAVDPIKAPVQPPVQPVKPSPVQPVKPVEPIKVVDPKPVQPIKAPVPAPVQPPKPAVPTPKPKKAAKKTGKRRGRKGNKGTRRGKRFNRRNRRGKRSGRRNRRSRGFNAWPYFTYADKVWGPDSEEFFYGDSFDVTPYDDKIIKGN